MDVYTLPTVKHRGSGSNMIVWECFSSAGTKKLLGVEGMINEANYRKNSM